MKNILSTLALSALLMGASAIPASAGIISYTVTLSGTQSVPGNASTATGSAIVTVDDVANTVFVSLTFSGLTGGNAAAAHIHCCVAATGTAAVIIPFTAFPAATSGTYTNTFTTTAANIAGIEAFGAYINIHDATFPAGEIRGNITPEPATLSLMGLGLLAVAGAAARRRRRSI